MTRYSYLSAALLAVVLLALCAVAFGVSADNVSAHTVSEHQVIQFVDANVDRAAHVADTATAAAAADGNGNWVRATARIGHAVRDFLKLRQQWLRLPIAGGTATRLERKFDAMLEHIRIYVVSEARAVAGNWSYANLLRGDRAYDRAVSECADVLLELDQLR